MAEAADKNALTDEQLRRVINMLLRPKGGAPSGKKPFDPAKEPTNIPELAKSFKAGTESLDKLVSRLRIGDTATKGLLGAANLTNQYAKDAFKSSGEFQDTFAFGGDPNAEGTLWPAGSGVLATSGTRMVAKTLPEALKALGPKEKGALVGAKAGTYGSWLKDHSSQGTQAGVDDAVLQIGKTISEQSERVQGVLKKMMGDKAFDWAKRQNKPVFPDPSAVNESTIRALNDAGVKFPGEQPKQTPPNWHKTSLGVEGASGPEGQPGAAGGDSFEDRWQGDPAPKRLPKPDILSAEFYRNALHFLKGMGNPKEDVFSKLDKLNNYLGFKTEDTMKVLASLMDQAKNGMFNYEPHHARKSQFERNYGERPVPGTKYTQPPIAIHPDNPHDPIAHDAQDLANKRMNPTPAEQDL